MTVHREHPFEILAVRVEQQAERYRSERARVVDEDVDGAGHGRSDPGDAVDGRLVAHVAWRRVRRAALAPYLVRKVLDRRLVTRDENHLRVARASATARLPGRGSPR